MNSEIRGFHLDTCFGPSGCPNRTVDSSRLLKRVEAILEKEPLGMDIVYECAGQQETLDEAVELLKPGGKLVLIGIPRFERVSFSIDQIRRKELTLINIRRQNDCTQAAIDLVASGKINVDFMTTHRFKFEDTSAAFDMVEGYRDGVVKAMISL